MPAFWLTNFRQTDPLAGSRPPHDTIEAVRERSKLYPEVVGMRERAPRKPQPSAGEGVA